MGAQPRSTNAQNRENMGSFTQDLRWSTLELNMRTLALILLSSLLRCCYAQSSIFNPPQGQRCRGRNFDGKRCCTPEQPCGLGEGDCDGPTAPVIVPGTPLKPPPGQRCRGRNYDGRRCCTPENPCGEGEGDCDGAGDGGLNDGDTGCRGDLVCGSNNCKQFGAYYHEKDDCCMKPAATFQTRPIIRQQQQGWGPWGQWGPCDAKCETDGWGRKVRTRKCVGSKCGSAGFHNQDLQERNCQNPNCNTVL